MARKRRWEETFVGNGFVEVKLFSWKYFYDFIHQEMLDYQTYIWRGQRCDDWPLDSTLDRLTRQARIGMRRAYSFRRQHLEQFKYAVRGRRGQSPPLLETDNDWWALGQHYGLATPLLDWTTSPFVAAYFAFIGMGEKQSKYRVIFGIHKPTIERKVKDILSVAEKERLDKLKAVAAGESGLGVSGSEALKIPKRPEVEFIRPLSDENQRLVNQGGLFTRFPPETDVQSWVMEHFTGDTKAWTLIKIYVPNRDRAECLKALNRMNINHLTLFPDLYGASKFCNLFAEIERY